MNFENIDPELDEKDRSLKMVSRWPENPQQPCFQIEVKRRGGDVKTIMFAPERWASNRRDLCGWSWPGREYCSVYFADISSAVDLDTGEKLSRCGLWKTVLHHRDDELPWYVRWADQHLMVLCLVGFVRQELGQFKSAMRARVNSAMIEAGHVEVDDEGFKFITQAMKVGYQGSLSLGYQVALLTEVELLACRKAAFDLLSAAGRDASCVDAVFPCK
ncbi:hypothetical protein ACF8OH_27175 [Delftia sp. WSY_9]|uniref:hypothetical protein n=1 Tax=unclassified Delftia TaxID=2613839 RepID=UPI00370C746B